MVRGRKNVISYFSRKRHGLGHAVSPFITSFKNKVHKVEENADVLPLFLSGVSMSISACGQEPKENVAAHTLRVCTATFGKFYRKAQNFSAYSSASAVKLRKSAYPCP